LYTLALDQGFLLSMFQGAQAFDMNLIHELIHDTRHAAGFPCHEQDRHDGGAGQVRAGAHAVPQATPLPSARPSPSRRGKT
jgi:hypothetical protein